MKLIIIGMVVPDGTEDEIAETVNKLVEDKKGEMKQFNVSDAPPQGAGATLGDVS